MIKVDWPALFNDVNGRVAFYLISDMILLCWYFNLTNKSKEDFLNCTDRIGDIHLHEFFLALLYQ